MIADIGELFLGSFFNFYNIFIISVIFGDHERNVKKSQKRSQVNEARRKVDNLISSPALNN